MFAGQSLRPLCLVAVLVVWPAGQSTAGEPASAAIDYNLHVRPILAKHCFSCHGRDEAHRAKKLRLDERGPATAELEDGAVAIVPGDPDASELVSRIASADESLRMPPAKAGARLGAEQAQTLKRWIEQGAPYAEHWAFRKPVPGPIPKVKDQARLKNPIDRFVQAALEAEGLAPAPEADRYALLRRLSLDLRGLPPSPEEIKTFISDLSPQAYERAVDRFLADPAYGERWARVWLDLARYADSAGYGSDPLRTIWRYRDWVIDAFNANMPYDRFTITQIAGDLLENPTLEDRMATAFHRNTMTNTEGGTDDEEFRSAAVKDRVDSTGLIWMGLTFGCAKCHDHKYDPITQKEYYQLYAFFNQTADNDQPDESPTIEAPDERTLERIEESKRKLAQALARIALETPQVAAARAQWEASLSASAEWTTPAPDSLVADSGGPIVLEPDGSISAGGDRPANADYALAYPSPPDEIRAIRLEAIPDRKFVNGGSGRGDDGNFVLSRFTVETVPVGDQGAVSARFVRIELPGKDKILSLAEVEVLSGGKNVARDAGATQSTTAYNGDASRAIDGVTEGDYFKASSVTHTAPSDNPWWEADLKQTAAIDLVRVWNRTDGGSGARLAGFRLSLLDESRKPVYQTTVEKAPNPNTEFRPGGPGEVAIARAFADFSQTGFPVASAIGSAAIPKATGWAVAPKWSEPHTAVFIPAEPIRTAGRRLIIKLRHQYKEPRYTLGRFRISTTSDPAAAARAQVPDHILAIVDTPADKRTDAANRTLAEHFRSISPIFAQERAVIERLKREAPKPPTLPVMVELPAAKRRETRILNKGSFLDPGGAVSPGTPAAFHVLQEGAPRDRLALARWLVAPDNPLTARVAVNRLWSQLFGTGIVETEEDFGAQGDPPSRQDLLDWLALEYMRLGWDTKAILRTMVCSATYRQSARATPEAHARDPRNRLLARGPSLRLEAEMVRDQALAIAGLLSRKMHGPSIFPPQPDGLWQAAFNGERTWKTSTGEDRYRRGLYVFWRRTVPYPSMATFDAPSREFCVARRMRANTPLQALVTLNDPVFVECAQAFARRIVRDGGSTGEERARFALELALARPASEAQIAELKKLYESELERLKRDPTAARELATIPLGPAPAGADAAELAAWTAVANAILNLDAIVMKR